MSAVRVGTFGSNGEVAAHPGIERYTLMERIVHWEVALTFIALMVSGFALGYPRAYFLSGLFGGGQTMRFLHPWFGVAFTLGILWMLFSWARKMRMTAVDKEWVKRLRTYTRAGHTGLDIGRFNAGQKGYYWFSVVLGIVLFLTGLPLWGGFLGGAAGWHHVARFLHHGAFLLMVGGFIIHVYMSTVMFPGTMSAMTTGRVTRAWAAWHHPAWFRERDRRSAAGANR
jgi:formate dehydrogenase subunit gamma